MPCSFLLLKTIDNVISIDWHCLTSVKTFHFVCSLQPFGTVQLGSARKRFDFCIKLPSIVGHENAGEKLHEVFPWVERSETKKGNVAITVALLL